MTSSDSVNNLGSCMNSGISVPIEFGHPGIEEVSKSRDAEDVIGACVRVMLVCWRAACDVRKVSRFGEKEKEKVDILDAVKLSCVAVLLWIQTPVGLSDVWTAMVFLLDGVRPIMHYSPFGVREAID